MSECFQDEIKNGFLDKLVNLQELNMFRCNQVSNGFLDKLINLRVLDMSYCN